MENLSDKNKKELSDIAKGLGLKNYSKLSKEEIISLINENTKKSTDKKGAKKSSTKEKTTKETVSDVKSVKKEVKSAEVPLPPKQANPAGDEGYYEKTSYYGEM